MFDLDNTLYPAECGLFSQVDARMGAFIGTFLGVGPQEARRVQKDYYRRYGTTLRGLMTERGVDPLEFLAYVHDIDHSPVVADERLREAIGALPGRRFILTNGSRRHAEAVAGRIGILDLIDDIFDIAAAGFEPKPSAAAYDRFIASCHCNARESAMFEDLARNLEIPHARGMATVLVRAGVSGKADWELEGAGAPHVDHVTDDLAGFLRAAVGRAGSPA